MLCLKGVAQDSAGNWNIEVKGLVTENDKKLPGAVITVYDGASVVNTINSGNGKFDFQLEAGKAFTITFSKPGYITKRISFSTKNVPADRGKYKFIPFEIDEVDIFPEVPGTNVDSILQQPIAKINYDPKYHSGDFNFDESYTESIQSLLDKILAAKKALEAMYKRLISKADAEFGKQTYSEAKDDYTSALKLKPNEQYPKDKLAAIEKALEALKGQQQKDSLKAAQQKALRAKYDSVVKLADAAFGAGKYKDAQDLYNNALGIIPDQKYPKDQLDKIDKILAEKKKNQEESLAEKAAQARYDSIIKLADNNFHQKNYAEAKSGYENALQLKPHEQYPKAQIAEVDRLIAALNKPVINADSLAKAKQQKGSPKPSVVHVQVSPCNIQAMGDSCRVYLRPFAYAGVNALHIPLKADAQEPEINFPAFSGQRYRIIINLAAMPQGTTISVYDKDNGHKRREPLYTVGDAVNRISTFDTQSATGRFYIDYEIPGNDGPPTSCCAVIMLGYETK